MVGRFRRRSPTGRAGKSAVALAEAGGTLFLQIRTHLQVGLDRRHAAAPKMRVLAVAKGARAAFRSIVGGFPRGVVEEHTQPTEMVQIEMLLLSAQRSDLCCLSISPPDLVALLRFSWSSPLSTVVLLDGEPLFKERASRTTLTADGPVRQADEPLMFFGGQILGSVKKQSAIQPQVLSQTADLVPVTPGEWRRLNFREQVGRAAQFGDGGRIGWFELEPLADRAVADAELASNRPSGRDVLVQRMGVGDAQRSPGQAPPIPFRVWVMLIGRRRRPTKAAEQGRLTRPWWRRQRASDVFDHPTDGADHAPRGVEQAQLVHRCWPELGQHRRVQTGSSVMTSSGLIPAARRRSRNALTIP